MTPKARQLLDSTDWAKLHHAYGPANDVPSLIEAFWDPNQQVRDHATYELFGNIWHQGTVYEATASAAQVIVEAAVDPSAFDRSIAFALLQAMASGISGDITHRDAAHLAVRRELGRLLECMDDPSPEIRQGATFVACSFPEDAPNIAPHICHALRFDADANVRACAAIVLGELGYLSDEIQTALMDAVKAPTREQICCAIAIANLLRMDTPADIRQMLQSTLPHINALCAQFGSTCFDAERSMEDRLLEAASRCGLITN